MTMNSVKNRNNTAVLFVDYHHLSQQQLSFLL